MNHYVHYKNVFEIKKNSLPGLSARYAIRINAKNKKGMSQKIQYLLESIAYFIATYIPKTK